MGAASSVPERAAQTWVRWPPVSTRVTALTLAPVLLALALFKLAISDGGQHLQSLTWAQTATLLILAVLLWAGVVRRVAVAWPMVGMIAAVGLTSVFSVRQESSVREGLLWLMYVSIFIITASTLPGPDAARRFVDATVAIGGWLCLVALFLFWGADNPAMRWYATFYWPNPFAAFLLLLLPVALVHFLHARGAREGLAHGAITLLLAVALVLTYSRGAWVSLGLITPLALLVLHPPSWIRLVGRVVLLALLVMLSVVLLTRGAALRDASGGVVGRAASVSRFDDYSIQGRLNFWGAGLRIFRDYPIFGTGAGTFGAIHPVYQRDVRFYAKDAHNLYLQTAAEMGLVGAIALAILLVSIAALWIRTLHATRNTGAYPLVAGVGLGLIAFFVHSALDMNWSFPANPAMAFALAGALAAYDSAFQAPPARSRLAMRSAGWRRLGAVILLVAVAIVQVFYAAQRQFVEGQRLAQADQWLDAADRYARAARWNPLSAKYFASHALAASQLAKPQFEIAAASVRRAMALDRMNAAYPLQLAQLIMAQQAVQLHGSEAETLLRLSLRLDRFNRPEAYRTLAQLYLRQGRIEDAEGVYRSAMALYRGHNLGRGSIIYTRLWPEVTYLFLDAAALSVRRGDVPHAAQVLQDLLAEDPSAVPAALRLSTIYRQLGRSADARRVLEAVAARLPDNAEIRAALDALR